MDWMESRFGYPLCDLWSPKLLKVLHGFLSFDTSKHVQGRHILRLASWASRYTTVLRVLSPFTATLYSQISGLKNIDAYLLLDEPTVVVIWMWRATLLQLAARSSSFSRPLDTFSSDAPHCLLEYDSCLTGLGFRDFPRDLSDLPPAVSLKLARPFCGQTELPFACGADSSFQNTAEFTAPTMGLVALARRGFRHLRVSLQGDSKTSLAWSKSGHFTGSLCTRAAIVMMLTSVEYDFTIVEAVHIPGDENGVCDDLSRFRTTPALLGYSARDPIDFKGDPIMTALLRLCDPTLPSPFLSEDAFLSFWTEVRSLVCSLQDMM
jgi:hypothetical protein